MVIAGKSTAEEIVNRRAVQNTKQITDAEMDARFKVHNICRL